MGSLIKKMLNPSKHLVIPNFIITFASLNIKTNRVMTREELIAMRERITEIDTTENRKMIAEKIASNIFSSCSIGTDEPKDTEVLRNWLINNIMSYTLADAILTEFKVYIIRLVKKVCSDICYISKPSNVDDFLDAVKNYGKLSNFIGYVLYHTDFVEDIDKFYAEVQHNTEVTGFKDTLILDKTTYVLDNTGRPCYLVELHIGYHRNYTIDNLRERINGRLHYQWRLVGVKSIYVEKLCDGSYFAQIVLFSDNDLDTIKEMIAYRFGRTSGKPWYRCVVADVTEQTPAND